MPIGDPLYKNLLANFKKGLYYEANDDYSKVNDSIPDKQSQALGKYQFVPKYHWSKIQALAKQRNIPVPKTYDDFLKEPVLQEEYFEHYFQKEVFPFIEQNKNRTRELSADELAYLYHHNGKGGAQTYVSTGKLPEATKYNPSGNEFIKNYKAARADQGGEPVQSFTQNYVDRKYNAFNIGMAAINKNPNKLSEELLNEKRIQFQLGYQKEGLIDYFNHKIQQENKVKITENQSKINTLNKLSEVMQDGYSLRAKDLAGKDKAFEMRITPEQYNDLKKEPYFKKYEKYFTPPGGKLKGYDNEKETKYVMKVPFKNDKNNILNEFQNDVKTIPGNENFKIYDGDKPLSRDQDSFGEFFSNILNAAPSVNKDAVINNRLTEDTALKFPKIVMPEKGATTSLVKPLLVPIAVPEEAPIDQTTKEDVKTTPAPTPVNPNQPTTSEMDKWIAYDKEKEQKANDGILSDYFSSERDVTPVEDPNAKKKDTFPYADILAQIGGTVAGLSMAKEKINYRDEQVNDDFRNYTAELSKLSQIGLRPEEEAYAKRMLTEAYQGSVDRITSASNGNRNSILGNLGRVDEQRNKGLMEIALADAQAKNEAFYKYGEATKYINEFDARRDIANNERKYQNILQTKAAGSEVAGAAMSAFIDSIHNYQDNKPGSWNDAYKSHMSRRLFGVDTTLKDDGTGTIPYTASWKAKNDHALLNNNEEFNQYRGMFASLSEEDQKTINDKFRASGGDIKSTYKLIDAAKNATQTPASPYADLFKKDPSVSTEPTPVLKPVSTEATPAVNGISTETSPVLNAAKVPDILSGNMPAYSNNAVAQPEEDEGQKTLNLLKNTKMMMQEVLAKSDQGLIETDKANTLLDQMTSNAQKMF